MPFRERSEPQVNPTHRGVEDAPHSSYATGLVSLVQVFSAAMTGLRGSHRKR